MYRVGDPHYYDYRARGYDHRAMDPQCYDCRAQGFEYRAADPHCYDYRAQGFEYRAPQNINLNNNCSINRGKEDNNNINLSQVEKLRRNRNKQYVRNCRLRKKVKSLQNGLDQCKKKMSDETFLEVSEQAQSIPDHLLSA